MLGELNEFAQAAAASASDCRFLPKNHAIPIETTYRTIIGAAKSIMLGISPVGDTRAATIRIITIASFQLRKRNPAEITPIRANT
jgi:hypothetical protein